VEGKRQGGGSCQFADGSLFHGQWEEDQWMQSEAEPGLCRVSGSGLSSATAGIDAVLTIKVDGKSCCTTDPTPLLSSVSQGSDSHDEAMHNNDPAQLPSIPSHNRS